LGGAVGFFPLFAATSAATCPHHYDSGSEVTLNLVGFVVMSTAIVLYVFVSLMRRTISLEAIMQRIAAMCIVCSPFMSLFVVQYAICQVGDSSKLAACYITTSKLAEYVGISLVNVVMIYLALHLHFALPSPYYKFMTANKKDGCEGIEAIYFLRTWILVMIIVLTDNGVFQACVAAALLICSLIYQQQLKPYKSSWANNLEAVSLTATIMFVFIGMIGAIVKIEYLYIAVTLKSWG
jgi:hypothetical protein